jgi:hypothetical protein
LWLSVDAARPPLFDPVPERRDEVAQIEGNTSMPVRQAIVLIALFGACLAFVGMAWAVDSRLYLFLPSRRISPPPTHPAVILILLVASLPLTYWFRQNGVYFFIILAAGILLGSAVGFFLFQWTPSWAQHLLAAAMIATSTYGWQQKYYFED